MQIAVIGTGYVGLVTGACFAEMGNTVICVDTDHAKVQALREGNIPIYEPGLEAIVKDNLRSRRLQFTTELQTALVEAEVIFIAVGTPPNPDGSADLSAVLAVAEQIGQHLDHFALIVSKSTVPVGTAERIRSIVREALAQRKAALEFAVVSNPEFLKEGAAIDDFMRPDRIIVGVDDARAREVMQELYAPFNRNHQRMLFMGVRDAELSKYAANAMLATKISFMNEMANLCERLGVDVENVRLGIGSDRRIGYDFIYPGCGYGGSCFPKDIKALISMAENHGFAPAILKSVELRNEAQKRTLFEKITRRFGADLGGHRFAVWGLAFKPGTDDMRAAPSLVLIQALIEAGAMVQAYDPAAMQSVRRELPEHWFDGGGIRLAEHQYDALKDADALVLVTEWKPFRHPDLSAMKKLMRKPVVFDGRNQYAPRQLRQEGFEYIGVGR
ncbi:MAG: UDP-glucose/GDP-mannose dehydrogenase family protein [Gammaproteobacteria bacterium]